MHPLCEVVFESIASGGTARIEAQLAVDRLDMRTDCVRAKDEAPGDLAVAQSHREQAQHLEFPWRQRIGRGRGRWRGPPPSSISAFDRTVGETAVWISLETSNTCSRKLRSSLR